VTALKLYDDVAPAHVLDKFETARCSPLGLRVTVHLGAARPCSSTSSRSSVCVHRKQPASHGGRLDRPALRPLPERRTTDYEEAHVLVTRVAASLWGACSIAFPRA
jgi:hypothetical protein